MWEVDRRTGGPVYILAFDFGAAFLMVPKDELLTARQHHIGRRFYHAPVLSGTPWQFQRPSPWAIVLDTPVEVPLLEAFTIRDVVIGLTSDRTTYLIVESITRPGRPLALRAEGYGLTETDRGEVARWPQALLAAVRERRPTIGMTRAQVLLALGPPKHRERITEAAGTTEEWQYGLTAQGSDAKSVFKLRRQLSFANDKLARIRDLE
jgi:hypothetical protein